MKVLVTGGAGFIGSHLVEKLLAEKCDVVVLDNLHTGLLENVPTDVTFINMDIQEPALENLLIQERFDMVVHLAGQTMVNVSVHDPLLDESINIHGTVRLLEACRKSGVQRIIFASTAAVYGGIEALPIEETASLQPMSFYGLSKLTVEKYLALYHQLYGLQYAALRFANVYGERQGDGGEGGVISIFAKNAAKGSALTVFGDGGQTRDFIYVGDIAAGIYRALISDSDHGVYNLGTNTEVSVNEMISTLQEVGAGKLQVDYQEPRLGDIYRSMLSNQKARTYLDWKPQTSLKDGLAKTYRYFLSQV